MRGKGRVRRIEGIPFWDGRSEEALLLAEKEGLTVTAPAGPNLADWYRKPVYAEAMRRCDLAMVDSGAFVLIWLLLTGERLQRESGLKFLEHVLPRLRDADPRETLWVMPDEGQAEKNRAFLLERGIEVKDEQVYCAPRYDPEAPEDQVLLERVRAEPLKRVFLQIGGGIQEPLAVWLRDRLEEPRPAIYCTGAALAFLSGEQVRIPVWVDRAFLGWIWRIGSKPKLYGRRYFRALRLVWVTYLWARR